MQTQNSHLIFTIIAPNYGPQAMILGESIAKNIPEAIFRIIVLQDCKNVETIQGGIDEYKRLSGASSDHLALTFQEFDWSCFDVENCVNQYDLLEFATSVKPTIMKNYISMGYTRVTYLDPDIQVFDDFTDSLSPDKSISVTPHILGDFPEDSKLPDQQSILYAGVYNLGFISVLAESMIFLEWWEKKLNKYCTMAVKDGYHVDQKWVDWAINFVDIDTVRDPGLNVAYWNLHERKIIDGGVKQLIDKSDEIFPLRFFHFSGFVGPGLEKISKHCTRKFDDSLELRSLLKSYYDRRKYWQKFLRKSIWSLGGRLGGSALPSEWRSDILELSRNNTSLIWSKKSLQVADRQICECMECDSTFSRDAIFLFLHQIESRSIRQLRSESQQKIALELYKNGYSKKSLSEADIREISPSKLLIIGYFGAPTGVGQIARNTLRLMEDFGIPVNIHTLRTGFDDPLLYSEYESKQQMTGNETTVIAFVNADMWIEHLVETRLINLEKQFVVGIWAWEIEHVPPYFRVAREYTSKVYAISQFSAEALSNYLGEEISAFPTYGNIPIHLNKDGNENNKYILARFDAKSVIERKNPEGVLDMWALVEQDLTEYQLFIKSIDLKKFANEDLINKLEKSKRIRLIDEVLDESQNSSLLQNATAFVSLHRAEGLGLNILEAVAADIPAISTNYSGISTEIENMIFGVDFELIDVGNNAAPYPPEGSWADPNIHSAAAQLMKAVKSVESGLWSEGSALRHEKLELFLQKAQNLALANTLQFLSWSESESNNRSERRKIRRIPALGQLLPIYSRLPKRVRIILRRYFLKYFSI
jgi:glycosyltransferase involved in cell wall biosynthesis